MSESIIIALIGLAGVALGALGSMLTSKATAKKNRDDIQLSLLNELQEERNRLDAKLEKQEERHSKDVADLNKRIDDFYAEKSASRRYIAALEAHIILGSPPPPPEPPEGYVP